MLVTCMLHTDVVKTYILIFLFLTKVIDFHLVVYQLVNCLMLTGVVQT